MNPPKMMMLTVALALSLAMAACRQDSATVPTPSDTQAVAPSVSETATAGQLRSALGAETQPTPTTTPTPVSPTPTPEEVREAVAEPTATPTPTPAAVSPTPTPPEVASVVDQSTPTAIPPTVGPTSTPQVIRIPAPPVRVVVKAVPTPEEREIVYDGGTDNSGPCGPFGGGPQNPPMSTEFGAEYSTRFLEWTTDGRHLVSSGWLGHRSTISIVDAEGSQIRTIVDANPYPWSGFIYGFYARPFPGRHAGCLFLVRVSALPQGH